jgi:N-acyl homoserine lactone hydrolase
MAVRRIVPLTLGWEELPRSISIHGGGDQLLLEPVPGILVECDDGWVLLDTGFNTALIRDPWLRQRYHGSFVKAVLPGPGEPLEESLAAVGIDMDDVMAVAVSHLHNDHAGGVKLFAGRVPVHVQRAELAFGLSARAEAHAIFRVDFDDPRIDWRQADGDTEIAPGITAVSTPGHTVGHQSFIVDLPGGGGFVFAFDAADLTENIDGELPVGGFIDTTPEATVEPIRRLKRLAAERGYRLIPGHDPVAWPALTKELGGVPRTPPDTW